MTNPLLQKYDELYGEKKDEKTIADELKERKVISTSNAKVSINPKPSSLVSYDIDSGRDSFLQIAEKVKKGDARVTSVRMNADTVGVFYTGLRTITFEVYLYDNP
jgi:hypothetical protein